MHPINFLPATLGSDTIFFKAFGRKSPLCLEAFESKVSFINSLTGPFFSHSFKGTGNPILSLRFIILRGTKLPTAFFNSALVRPPENFIAEGRMLPNQRYVYQEGELGIRGRLPYSSDPLLAVVQAKVS